MNKTLNTNLLLCARNLSTFASQDLALLLIITWNLHPTAERRRVHGLLGLQVRSSCCISDKRDNTVLPIQTNRRISVFAFLPG